MLPLRKTSGVTVSQSLLRSTDSVMAIPRAEKANAYPHKCIGMGTNAPSTTGGSSAIHRTSKELDLL